MDFTQNGSASMATCKALPREGFLCLDIMWKRHLRCSFAAFTELWSRELNMDLKHITFSHTETLGVSLNGGIPKNTPKWSFLVGKPMVVEYHHFRKPPNWSSSLLQTSSPLGGSGYRILTGMVAQSPPILLGNDMERWDWWDRSEKQGRWYVWWIYDIVGWIIDSVVAS